MITRMGNSGNNPGASPGYSAASSTPYLRPMQSRLKNPRKKRKSKWDRYKREVFEPGKIFWFAPLKSWAIKAPKDPLAPKSHIDDYIAFLEFELEASFSKTAHTFIIEEDKLDLAKSLLDKFFGKDEFGHKRTAFIVEPKRVYEAGKPREVIIDYASILEEILDVDVRVESAQDVKSKYRKKAFSLHPDRGGDAALMSKLNMAFAAYKKEYCS